MVGVDAKVFGADKVKGSMDTGCPVNQRGGAKSLSR